MTGPTVPKRVRSSAAYHQAGRFRTERSDMAEVTA